MSTSERTFNQVKAILNKLDRAVDDARNKRTMPGTPAPSPATLPVPSAPVATAPAPVAQPKTTSQYGRAQPIRPAQTPPASMRWNPPAR